MLFDLDCGSGLRPKIMLSLSGFGVISLLIICYTVGTSYYAVSGYGDWSVPGQEMITMLCLLGMLLMAVALFGLTLSKVRCISMAIFLGCGLMVMVGIFSLKTADKIRMDGFVRLTQEAAPLVAAIHEYSDVHGFPPESLDDLQFKYPDNMAIKGDYLPEFKYYSGTLALERYHGNNWVLMLETPTGPLKWDQFIYYPSQNYPSLGHNGWLERIGKWAYVHE